MTHGEKIKYMEIATAICHFGLPKKDLDLILSLYDLILAKEDNTDLGDILEVKNEIEAKYTEL